MLLQSSSCARWVTVIAWTILFGPAVMAQADGHAIGPSNDTALLKKSVQPTLAWASPRSRETGVRASVEPLTHAAGLNLPMSALEVRTSQILFYSSR
jgi:hypothetical protein